MPVLVNFSGFFFLTIIQNKKKVDDTRASHVSWQLVAGAFCNTFDLHKAIVGLENQFLVVLRMAVLHMFYCISFLLLQSDEIYKI